MIMNDFFDLHPTKLGIVGAKMNTTEPLNEEMMLRKTEIQRTNALKKTVPPLL